MCVCERMGWFLGRILIVAAVEEGSRAANILLSRSHECVSCSHMTAPERLITAEITQRAMLNTVTS